MSGSTTADRPADTAPSRPASNAFSDAVHAVERVLSFRTKPTSATATTSVSPNAPEAAGQQTVAAPQIQRDTLHPHDFATDSFPILDEAQLLALLPAPAFDHVRHNVRAALEEMQLNFSLDPKALGNERTKTNQGYLAIALLLSRIQVCSPNAQGDSTTTEGHLSGPVNDGEGRSTDRSEGEGPSSTVPRSSAGAVAPPPRRYETHDLLKAIDRRDSETILAIRDANFDLLLDLSAGGGATGKTTTAAAQAGGTSNTPLGYAIGLGKGWEGIAIVLVGALSRFVNTLPDEEEVEVVQQPANLTPGAGLGSGAKKKKRTLKTELDPRTMQRLRKVRANLKLAIDHSIFTDQTRLLASYMQVLVMSEGTPFLLNSISSLTHTLSTHPREAMVSARSAVLQFVTDALRHKTDRVAAVRDYVSNAIGDLILLALWEGVKLRRSELHHHSSSSSTTTEEREGEEGEEEMTRSLPLYFFARDDRVTIHFIERMEKVERFRAATRGGGAGGGRMGKLARKTAEVLQHGSRRLSAEERRVAVERVLAAAA